MDEKIFTFSAEEWVDPELRVFFASEKSKAKIREIAERYGLDAANTEKLFRVVRHVITGRISDEEVADDVESGTGVEYDTALEIQGDLWAELLSDVGELLAAQHGVYQDLHGEEFLPESTRVEDAFVLSARQAIGKSGFVAPDAVLAHRLETAATSYLKDVRDDAETKVMLEKPVKTGGMGMTSAAVATLMLLLAEAKGGIAAVKEEVETKRKERETLELKAREKREATVRQLQARFADAPKAAEVSVQQAAPESAKEDLFVDNAEETKEIEDIERETASEPVPVQAAGPTLDQAVDEAMAMLGISLPDPDLARRFHTLVSLYFRDLRDKLETKSKFTMPIASGGMGMADADAEKYMAELEAKVTAYHTAPAARVVEEKSKYVTEQAEKHFTENEARGAKEQKDIEHAYASLLAKTGLAAPQPQARPEPMAAPRMIPVMAMRPSTSVPVSAFPKSVLQAPAPSIAPAAAMASPQPMPAPAMPLEQKAPPPPNLPVEPLSEEMMTHVVPAPAFVPAVSAPTPVSLLSPVMASKPTVSSVEAAGAMGVSLANAKAEEKDASVVESPVRTAFDKGIPGDARSTPRPAPTPQQIAPVSAKPTMTDVQSAPRLTGPVQELSQITLEDFRRLSREPKEATLKIKDKVDLLDELGFETKTQGVKAFLESPINRLYLDVLRASLEGKPVPEVIAAMEARGTPTLSKPEFDSLMDLNRRLRFG